MGNTILAKGGNHILAKRDNSAWPKGSKLSGFSNWLCKDRKIFAMTLFEILNFNRELLERLAGTGYKPDDYKYIDLYREYEQMRRKGDKVTYCVAFLSARHGVSERKVYEILGRFKKECTFHTV